MAYEVFSKRDIFEKTHFVFDVVCSCLCTFDFSFMLTLLLESEHIFRKYYIQNTFWRRVLSPLRHFYSPNSVTLSSTNGVTHNTVIRMET